VLEFDLHLDIAARTLRAGGIVAHACEGVWGLACDPFDPDVVARLAHIKQRSLDKGLIVIAAAARNRLALARPIACRRSCGPGHVPRPRSRAWRATSSNIVSLSSSSTEGVTPACSHICVRSWRRAP